MLKLGDLFTFIEQLLADVVIRRSAALSVCQRGYLLFKPGAFALTFGQRFFQRGALIVKCCFLPRKRGTHFIYRVLKLFQLAAVDRGVGGRS